MVVPDNAHKSHDETPRNHDEREPAARTELLEQQVARNLERRIGEEESGQAPIVLVICHFEILLETLNLCVSDIPTCFQN